MLYPQINSRIPVNFSNCNGYSYISKCVSTHYVKDMGTPERFASVSNDFSNGTVKAKNLSNKQKALFLDRDGTINKYVGFLRKIDDLELIDGVAEAIKKINSSDYLCIVATNQPVIARGEVSYAELEEIHMKMETLLGKEGAYIDGLYYCPHHPHKGYEGGSKGIENRMLMQETEAGDAYSSRPRLQHRA